MLRDRLVCGCLDKRLQCKLLADPDLTFAKALATAKAMETAERSAKDLHGDSTGQVHLMRRRPTRNRRSGPPKAQSQVSSTCSRCGAAHSAYPLPRIEDIFASLSNGKTFTKLDLAHAYQQIPVAEDAKKLTTISTHKGLFQYTRLPFGVASAPACTVPAYNGQHPPGPPSHLRLY